jgi:tetratricopeptide (TPR) repeat protein
MVLKWIAKRFGDPAADALAAARALRDRDEFDAAREACLDVLRVRPDEAAAMALIAAIGADQRRIDEGMQWARRALAVQADCVPAHFAMGRLFEAEGRWSEAEACYREVVRLDPVHAQGHTNLGCALHLQDRIPEAVACYRRALQLEPGQPVALRNLALAAGGRDELCEALQGFERHLREHPRDAHAHCQVGHLHSHLGNFRESLAAYERAIALAPELPEFRLARAQLLLLLGDFATGWREYEWRWKVPDLNGPMLRFPHPRWDGGPLDGTLLVHSEQGFGDLFQFVRYATLAAERCARVIVECKPALAELMAGVPGVAQVVHEGEPLPPFDAHIPPIAFPFTFGTTLDTVPWRGPYINADAQRVAAWATRVAASSARPRKVGLVWAGNPGNRSDRERRVELRQLGPLGQVPGTTFFSLQKGADAAQLAGVPTGMHFVDLTGDIHDFSDTAALIAQLDLVIAIDTSVAHLAGAMGRPTWLLLPHSPEWRWLLDRSDTPWYPSMRLFRQEGQGDWSAPVERVAAELRKWTAADPA